MNHEYFGKMAMLAAEQSTCLRRRFGAVIVDPKTKHPISTGFNGSPAGKEHCTDLGWCLRNELDIPAGERYECCRSCHAEQNALIRAGGRDTYGAYIYIAGFDAETKLPVVKPQPCFLCTKMIINAHIRKVMLYSGTRIIELDINKLYDIYIQELLDQKESKLNTVNIKE